MTIYTIAFTACLLWVPVLADDASARARLMGAWQEQGDSGKGTSIWVLETKGNSLHIKHSQGDQTLSEVECRPSGADCDGVASGKKVKISMYYNGPTLVQFETAGSDVTKRQFSVVEQPDMLELEVIPIIGSAKPETLRLKRMPVTGANP